MIWEIVKEERKALPTSIDIFNKAKLSYSSTNYLFITKIAGAEMRQRIDRDTYEQSIPQVNNTKSTKTKSTPHEKMFFKDSVALLTHILFRI